MTPQLSRISIWQDHTQSSRPDTAHYLSGSLEQVCVYFHGVLMATIFTWRTWGTVRLLSRWGSTDSKKLSRAWVLGLLTSFLTVPIPLFPEKRPSSFTYMYNVEQPLKASDSPLCTGSTTDKAPPCNLFSCHDTQLFPLCFWNFAYISHGYYQKPVFHKRKGEQMLRDSQQPLPYLGSCDLPLDLLVSLPHSHHAWKVTYLYQGSWYLWEMLSIWPTFRYFFGIVFHLIN